MHGLCHSCLAIKNATDKSIPTGGWGHAVLVTRGDPHKILIVGKPKSNDELRAEMLGRGGQRWLNAAGNRLQGDCWIQVFRGRTNDQSDGHLVFLGHGAIEATDVETAAESANPRWGAIATPHDVELKAFVRSGTQGGVTFWLCELIDPVDNAAAAAPFISLVPGVPPARRVPRLLRRAGEPVWP